MTILLINSVQLSSFINKLYQCMDGQAILEPEIFKLEFPLWYWYFCLDPVKDFNEHVWSKDPTTNPGLYDSLKVSYCGPCNLFYCIFYIYSKIWMESSCEPYDMQVYVPYCTSDGYSGRRPASSESGGYAFFGKVILRFFYGEIQIVLFF